MRKGYFHGPKDLQKQKNHAAAVNDVMRMRGCGEVCEKTLSMNRRLFICLGQGRAIPNRAVSEPLRGNKEKCSRTLNITLIGMHQFFSCSACFFLKPNCGTHFLTTSSQTSRSFFFLFVIPEWKNDWNINKPKWLAGSIKEMHIKLCVSKYIHMFLGNATSLWTLMSVCCVLGRSVGLS